MSNSIQQLLDPAKVQQALCRKDLLTYVEGSSTNYDAGWVHKDICNRLEKFSRDVLAKKSPRLMLFIPPRHGKSKIASEGFPVWHIGNEPSQSIITASYSADLSTSFSKKALALAQDDFSQAVFPKMTLDENSQRQNEWQTTKGGGYKAVGVGGSLTGHGANILIIDDPVKDWEEAISQRQRDKVWDWWTSTAYTRLMPGGGVIVIMTRWHEDDLAGRLIKLMEENAHDPHSDKWEIVEYPAIAERDEEHRKKGEPLHPSRFPLSKLKNIQSAVGDRVWTSLYQQKPRPDSGRYMSRAWFKRMHPSQLPAGLKWVRAWDLAVQATTSADYTASARVAIGELGDIFISGMVRYKKLWGASKQFIVQTAIRERVPLGVEAVGAMAIAAEEIRSALRGECIVKDIKTTKDKLTRALRWIDKAEAGKVYLVEDGDWIEGFLDECEAFDPIADSHKDDQVDAVSLGVEMVHARRTPRIIT